MIKGKRLKGLTAIFFFVLLLQLGFAQIGPMKAQAASSKKWNSLLKKYREKNNTDCLIFVQYKGGSNCRVRMFQKVENANGTHRWNRILACKGYVGQNGIGKQVQGDRKTPKGTYRITGAFGILDDSGTQIPYTKLNRYLYWSGEPGTYNTMVDSRELGHVPSGSEHLITYNPHYNYALVIGYNRKNIVGKGAAIFMHCTGPNPYTGGCVAVPEEKMKIVMRNVTGKTRICIY